MPKRANRRPPPEPAATRLADLAPGDEFVIRGRVLRHGEPFRSWTQVVLGGAHTTTLPPGFPVEQ